MDGTVAKPDASPAIPENTDNRKEIFSRFNLLRFPLILAVIFIHNGNPCIDLVDRVSASEHFGALNDIISFISDGLALVAVPLFFFISGFLFFREGSLDQGAYLRKLRSRVQTLVIPFLFWNVLIFALFAVGQHIPQTAPFFENALGGYGVIDVLTAIFGIGQDPAAYQFWFIRNLILLVICTPLIYVALRLSTFIFIAVVLVWWAATTSWPLKPALESLLFFSLGAAIAIRQLDPFAMDRLALPLSVVSTVAFAVATAYRPAEVGFLAAKLGIITGVPAALALGGVLERSRFTWQFHALAAASFFVFATHEPTLTIIRKVIFRVVPVTSLSVMIAYFCLPVAVAAMSVLGFHILRRIAPKFTSAITGGRAS